MPNDADVATPNTAVPPVKACTYEHMENRQYIKSNLFTYLFLQNKRCLYTTLNNNVLAAFSLYLGLFLATVNGHLASRNIRIIILRVVKSKKNTCFLCRLHRVISVRKLIKNMLFVQLGDISIRLAVLFDIGSIFASSNTSWLALFSYFRDFQD